MRGCRPLEDPEIQAILQSFTGRFARRDRALFVLGLKTGLRISELLSIRIGDVVQYGDIVERISIERRSTKGSVEGRTIILHPDAKAALGEWIDECRRSTLLPLPEERYLFHSQKGWNRPLGRRHAWRILKHVYRLNELSGKLATHSMRKTFAGRVYDALGRDLVKTQRALGHKDINSTAKYLSFRQEEIDAAILAI